MDNDTVERRQALQTALVVVFSWLSGHTAYFGDNHARLTNVDQWLDFLERNEQDATTAHQHYTLVQVLSDGNVIGAGFFQCSGRNVALHLFGVQEGLHRTGIGSLMIGWYLSGLPSTAMAGKVTLDTLPVNMAMRRWCRRFGSTQIIREEQGDLVIEFPIATCLAVLGLHLATGTNYEFPTTVGELTINVMFSGRHPVHQTADDPPPIINRPIDLGR